jgi:hypothetical protein
MDSESFLAGLHSISAVRLAHVENLQIVQSIPRIDRFHFLIITFSDELTPRFSFGGLDFADF